MRDSVSSRFTRNGPGVAAALCSSVFIAVLAFSAYLEPGIRVLHTFEALPYFAAAVLCLRRSKFGYALALAAGLTWVSLSGLRTSFVLNGFEQMSVLFRTGKVQRPDLLIAVPAAISTAGLAVSAVVGYARFAAKRWADLGLGVAAILGMLLFFALIFTAFAPQYLPIIPGFGRR